MTIPAIRGAAFARAFAVVLTGGFTFSLATTAFAAPSITISSPGANSHLSSLTAFTGTASDSGGIQKVAVNIVGYANDSTGFLYWNGTSWQANASNYDATLSTPVNNQVTWSWPSNVALPGTNFSPGRYLVRATAYNNANVTTGATNTIYSGTDSTAPTASFSSDPPYNSDYLDTLPYPSGCATDAGGIRRVRFSLQRIGESGNVYWTGSTWSTASTLFTGSVTPTGANDPDRTNVTWTGANMTLPTAENGLVSARYIWTFQVFDRAENVTTVTRTIYVRPEDHVNPVPVLSTPAPNSVQEAWTGAVSGTARDPEDEPGVPGSGIVRVTVLLYRSTSGGTEYYSYSNNTAAWGATQQLVYATLGAPDNNNECAWSATIPGLGGGNLPSGKYFLRVQAYDRYNNGASTSPAFYITPVDTTPPAASITTPASGANVSRLASLAGTAADEAAGSGLARVQIQLSHMFPNGTGTVKKYWTGSAWSTTATMLATLTTSPNWSITSNLPSGGTNLPSGTYTVKAYPYDNYENQGTTASLDFNVVANTAPVASGQTLATAYNTALPITLTAADAQGDAVIYSVTAQPSHGVLSGTAPNLTYTPNTGYSGPDSFTFTASDYELTSAPSAITINVGKPPLDLLVENSDGTWMGDDLLSADGAGQTLTLDARAGRTVGFRVKLEVQGTPEQISNVEEMGYVARVQVSAPGKLSGISGFAFPEGMNATQVAEALLSPAGLHLTGRYGDEFYLYAAATFPSDEAPHAGASASVSVVPLDAEGAETVDLKESAIVQVTSLQSSQPDLSIRRLAEDDGTWDTDPEIGVGLASQGAASTLELGTTHALRQRYDLRLKNIGIMEGSYELYITEPPAGWAAIFYGVTDGNSVWLPATPDRTENGWRVYKLNGGQQWLPPSTTRLLRFETLMGAGAALGSNYFPTLRVKTATFDIAVPGETDDVVIKHYGANIDKLLYSLDGETWTEVGTTPLEVDRGRALLFKTTKLGEGPWPNRPENLPKWDWNGVAYWGAQLAFTFDHATPEGTPETLTVSCGNSKSVQVKVKPVQEETLPE